MQAPWLPSWTLLSLFTDFRSPCNLFCCLMSTLLSGLPFCRSQYFNTLLGNSAFLTLHPVTPPLKLENMAPGLRLRIRIVSPLRSLPMYECVVYMPELVNCFVGCLERGIMLARILDSVPEQYTWTVHSCRSSTYTWPHMWQSYAWLSWKGFNGESWSDLALLASAEHPSVSGLRLFTITAQFYQQFLSLCLYT